MTMKSEPNHEVVDWLLQGDVAIQWQTMRDVLDLAETQWRPVRRRVAQEGWGRRLLDLRDPAGTWGGGIYTPKWTSTTYTLLVLRQLGLPRTTPAAAEGARLIADAELGARAAQDFAQRLDHHDLCVTGMTLALLTYFGGSDDRIQAIAEHLLRRQMADGGWNCKERQHQSHHSSLHTTINVLDGLADYARYRGKKAAAAVAPAVVRAGGFLLAHHLYRSHNTGQVIHPAFMQFSFPPRWHWDVLRGLDFLREVGAPRDERLGDAINLVQSKRLPDSRWKLEKHHCGVEFFRLEKPGQPSRWNTLRALRVLRWWDGKLLPRQKMKEMRGFLTGLDTARPREGDRL